jgi:Spy/CpxP family protein refolding chaperone
MKTTFKTVFVFLGIAAFLLAVPVAYASPFGAGMGGEHEYKAEKIDNFVKALDITPEQQELMKKHREESREKMEELRQALKETRSTLREELRKADPDKNAINSTTSDMKALYGKLIDYRVDNFLKMKEILTPEQFKKLTEMGEHHREKRGWKGHRERSKKIF